MELRDSIWDSFYDVESYCVINILRIAVDDSVYESVSGSVLNSALNFVLIFVRDSVAVSVEVPVYNQNRDTVKSYDT